MSWRHRVYSKWPTRSRGVARYFVRVNSWTNPPGHQLSWKVSIFISCNPHHYKYRLQACKHRSRINGPYQRPTTYWNLFNTRRHFDVMNVYSLHYMATLSCNIDIMETKMTLTFISCKESEEFDCDKNGHMPYYNDVIMSAMASQITSLTIFTQRFIQGADQRKHQSSASLAFVRGIHRWPVNSPHKGPSNTENVSIWWRHHANALPFYMCSYQGQNLSTHTIGYGLSRYWYACL